MSCSTSATLRDAAKVVALCLPPVILSLIGLAAMARKPGGRATARRPGAGATAAAAPRLPRRPA